MTASSKASFNGSTYTMDGPFTLYVTSGNVTISNVVVTSSDFATLIVSNSATNSILVDWEVPAHAVGLETTNQVALPGGEIVQINVNAVFPGLITYSTQLEHIMPALTTNTNNPVTTPTNSADIIPELLYYKMTEGFTQSNPPVYLADSSLHGGTTGTLTSGYVIAWVTNVASMPQSAVHFNGANTQIDTGNSTLFNFTTNLFTINVWVRPLVLLNQPVIIGNGSYLETGWYVFLSPVGAAGIAANVPGSSTYVATSGPCTSPEVWTMLTIARTGPTTVLIYANGILQNTVGSFMDPASCGESVLLGGYQEFSLHLDGDIGVTRIYDRVLSTNEINTLYTNAITGLVP